MVSFSVAIPSLFKETKQYLIMQLKLSKTYNIVLPMVLR